MVVHDGWYQAWYYWGSIKLVQSWHDNLVQWSIKIDHAWYVNVIKTWWNNKGEFRARPIRAFVYIFALGISECANCEICEHRVGVTLELHCKWIFNIFSWNQGMLFRKDVPSILPWGFLIFNVMVEISTSKVSLTQARMMVFQFASPQENHVFKVEFESTVLKRTVI